MAPGFNWSYVCSLVLLGNIAHVLKAFQEGINKKRGKKRVYVYIDWTNVQFDQDGPELFLIWFSFFFIYIYPWMMDWRVTAHIKTPSHHSLSIYQIEKEQPADTDICQYETDILAGYIVTCMMNLLSL